MQILPLGIGTHLPIILAFVPSSMKQYCPDMPHTRLTLTKSFTNLNIIGLGVAMDGCFQYENLLEQWEKDFFLINSEKMRNYYRCTYPDVDALSPIHLEVGLNSKLSLNDH